VEALTPPDHRARVGFCQWFLAKCFVNTQFIVYMLFAYDAEFTMEGIADFHNIHFFVDDSPHTTET
jgi:hypothetical protein